MSFDPAAFWSAHGAHLDEAGVPRRFGDPSLEHAALEEDRAVRWQGRGDVLRLTGHDTLDLLHRIAASEVRDLPATRAREVLFTTDKGRIVDLPALLVDGDDLLAVCGRGQAEPLAAWLTRYVITEDVTVDRLEDAHVLTFVSSSDVETAGSWVQGASRGAALDTPALAAWLNEHVPRDWILVGEDAYRLGWIEQGRLPAGPELSSGINPLEAGLRDVVSWTKGCYVGQEVVARLDTYEKVKRHLVVLHADAAWTPNEVLCDSGGKPVGTLLAVASRPGGGTAALALVDKIVGEGDGLSAQGATGAVVKAPAAT